MEQAKKHLKISSIVVLIFAAATMLKLAAEIFYGELSQMEGVDESILMITQIVLSVVYLIFMIPQIYVGVKGLKLAKNPKKAKAHIVWAIILLVFAAIGLISPVSNMIQYGVERDNISALLGILVEISVYFDYIKYAKELSKQAE